METATDTWEITPDFSEALESFTPIADGTYTARIEAVEKKLSKAAMEPYLSWTLRIFGATGDAARFNNRTFFYTTMLRGKGAGKLRELCERTGTTVKSGESFAPTALIGKEVEAAVHTPMNADGQPGFLNVKAIRRVQ